METKGKETMKKVCWFCGGSGAHTGLCGIREETPGTKIELDVVNPIFDCGGGQGVILADDPRAVALADPMKCLTALATDRSTAELYRHRFPSSLSNGLAGQTVGNVIWYGLLDKGYSPREAIAYMHCQLKVRPHHRVEPVSQTRADVCVRLEDSTVICGEAKIDVPSHDGTLRIVDAWLEPGVKTTPEVFKAIMSADMVIIGPGDLYSSLVPCLLPEGVEAALRHTRAKLVYVVNLMTKFGETNEFKALDFVEVVERYAGRKMDHIICNIMPPSERALAAYEEEMAIPVEHDLRHDERAIGAGLLDENVEGVLRHDSERLALLLSTLGETAQVSEVSAGATA